MTLRNKKVTKFCHKGITKWQNNKRQNDGIPEWQNNQITKSSNNNFTKS